MLLPSALGSSPHPPVSVYGTGPIQTIAAFLGSGFVCFVTSFSLRPESAFSQGYFSLAQPSLSTGLSIPGSYSAAASPQFCSMGVQEYSPAVHRMRLAASP